MTVVPIKVNNIDRPQTQNSIGKTRPQSSENSIVETHALSHAAPIINASYVNCFDLIWINGLN